MQYSLYGVSRWSCLSIRRLFYEPLSARLPPSDLIPGVTDTMCTVKQNLWLKVIDDSPKRNEFLHTSGSLLLLFFCLHGWHFSATWPQWDQNDRTRSASSDLSKYAQPLSQEFRELLQRLQPRLGMRRNGLGGSRGRGKKTALLTLFLLDFRSVSQLLFFPVSLKRGLLWHPDLQKTWLSK